MKGKICIGIPCFGDVPPEILEDYMRFAYHLGRRCGEWEFILGLKSKSEQFRARTSIAQAALEAGCEYIFWLDDDQLFDWIGRVGPSDCYSIVQRLVAHMEANPKAGIIGGLYWQKEGACFPVLMHGPKYEGGPCTFLSAEDITGGLQRVDIQGGGVMLMRCSALMQIPQPWWEPEHQFGTDIQICLKFAEYGWEVWSDTGIEVGHLQKQRAVITSKNREMYITDFVQRILDNRPHTLQICVAGWYFWEDWLRQVKDFNATLVCNRKPETGTGIPFVVRKENVGLEFGPYSDFLSYHWDGHSYVLFCHDDIELDGELYELLGVIKEQLKHWDQFYLFANPEEVAINGSRHGRMFIVSPILLSWIREQGGIWFDPENKGDNKEGPINRGIIQFDYMMAIASMAGFRTRGIVCYPKLRFGKRGELDGSTQQLCA